MNERDPLPTAADAADYSFDGTQIARLRPEDGQCSFQKLEWGSDAHIAFLERALRGLQDALGKAKAARNRRTEK